MPLERSQIAVTPATLETIEWLRFAVSQHVSSPVRVCFYLCVHLCLYILHKVAWQCSHSQVVLPFECLVAFATCEPPIFRVHHHMLQETARVGKRFSTFPAHLPYSTSIFTWTPFFALLKLLWKFAFS